MSAAFWCRVLNRMASAAPLRWLFRAPALGDRSSRAQFGEWDFQNAAATLRWYEPYDQIAGRRILDLGCGPGGKACYFAASGALQVVGVDVDPGRVKLAREGAGRRALGNAHFVVGDARAVPCRDGAFDMVMLNDAFEHVPEPAAVLREAYRVLRAGGTAHIAFPPFRSPWGGHLFAYIRIPWAHLLFPERELVALWKQADQTEHRGLVSYPRGWQEAGSPCATLEEIMPLNRMTLRRCEDLVAATPFRVRLSRHKTPGNLGRLLAKVGDVREYVVTRAMLVLEK